MLKYYIDNGYLPDVNLIPLIPTMTSNTTPSGVASTNSVNADNQAWKAFDNNSSTCWASDTKNGNEYIQYIFPHSVCVRAIYISTPSNRKLTNFNLECSNNGSNWTSFNLSQTSDSEKIIVPNNNYYVYYKVVCKQWVDMASGTNIADLQFYGVEQ